MGRFFQVLIISLLVGMGNPIAILANVSQQVVTLQREGEELLLDILGKRIKPNLVEQFWQHSRQVSELFNKSTGQFEQLLSSGDLSDSDPIKLASALGRFSGSLQHGLALEMLRSVQVGNVASARQWRALIQLPRHANAIEGALGLQMLANGRGEIVGLTQLLAREYVSWQSTRVREKLDNLRRVIAQGRATPELVAFRLSEIVALTHFPEAILSSAKVAAQPFSTDTQSLLKLTLENQWNPFQEAYVNWRGQVEGSLPNLLSSQEVNRRERLLLKLLRLIPKEYQAGVRDGRVVVPLEYREAEMFIVQAQQLVNELGAVWRQSRTPVHTQYGMVLGEQLTDVEELIDKKVDFREVEKGIEKALGILEGEYGLSLQRNGEKANVIEETVLDVRTSLKQSLAAAQAGRWAQAESLRLDAYTTFDTEIELRVLPRDPALAIQAERSFLDGEAQPGIKAMLDLRKRGPELEAAYQRTLKVVDECAALLKVGLSPTTVTFTAITIVMREGLEAVVILAALLAGLRGAANVFQRHYVIRGAWLALAVTGLTFWLSRSLITSLMRYGEKLEAVVSILAVIVLLMVTNWVFHKVYWVQWNVKLRQLSQRVEESGKNAWEALALMGVGFLTIYREGFETTLFMQSLILDGGYQPVLTGLGLGAVIVLIIGSLVFLLGAKLPYRRLLVITGLLVVSILATFVGSTVRIWQTVGWLPIHPIPSLNLPPWMGLWLGIYPSWEGILIPIAGLSYVIGMWLWVKLTAWRMRVRLKAQGTDTQPLSDPKIMRPA